METISFYLKKEKIVSELVVYRRNVGLECY